MDSLKRPHPDADRDVATHQPSKKAATVSANEAAATAPEAPERMAKPAANGHSVTKTPTATNGVAVPAAANGTPPARRLRVVVTGGSTGIGRSIVERFAAGGHLVLFSFLRSLDAATSLERAYPSLVTKTNLDQGDILSVSRFAETAKHWAGSDGVDVIVNNAALGSATVRGYVDSLADASADKTGTSNVARRAREDCSLMAVNALGPLWVTESLEPLLRTAASTPSGRGRAQVIFIGSVGGGSAAVFPEYRPADLMSKAAMTYLVKHLAAAYVRDDIDVMCVSPGATETEMFRQSTLSKVSDAAAFIDAMPKRRLIQPSDVADSVVWLATEKAARIFHGAVLDASLGLAVRPGLQTEASR